MPIHYFVGNRLLATTTTPPLWDDTRSVKSSHAFLCPVCGELWGRIAYDSYEWHAVHLACAKHQFLGRWGGSFILPWLRRLDHLPPEVLAYELALLLERH